LDATSTGFLTPGARQRRCHAEAVTKKHITLNNLASLRTDVAALHGSETSIHSLLPQFGEFSTLDWPQFEAWQEWRTK
jgi:hypothetical protein